MIQVGIFGWEDGKEELEGVLSWDGGTITADPADRSMANVLDRPLHFGDTLVSAKAEPEKFMHLIHRNYRGGHFYATEPVEVQPGQNYFKEQEDLKKRATAATDLFQYQDDDTGKWSDMHHAIHGHLRASAAPVGLGQLHKATAPDEEYDPHQPLKHPTNKALKQMVESGHVHAENPVFGEPSFWPTEKAAPVPVAAPTKAAKPSAVQPASGFPGHVHKLYENSAFLPPEHFDKHMAVIDAMGSKDLKEAWSLMGFSGKVTKDKLKKAIVDRRGGYLRGNLRHPAGSPEFEASQAEYAKASQKAVERMEE